MRRASVLLSTVAPLIFVPAARATTLYYDSFNYAVQDPNQGFSTATTLGQNEPWSPAWVGVVTQVQPWDLYQSGSSSPYVGSGSLSYPGLLVDTTPNSNNATYRGDGFGNHNGNNYRWFGQPATYAGSGPPFTTYPEHPTTSTTLYYSLLMRVTDMGPILVGGNFDGGQFPTAFTDALNDTNATAQSNTAGAFMIRPTDDLASSTTYQLGIANTAFHSTQFAPGTFALNQTHFIVVAYTMTSGTNTATLYVDPTPGSLQSSNTIAASITGQPTADLTGFDLRDDAHLPDGLSIDELRIGTTWADVTPAGVQPGTWNNAAGGSWQVASNWTASTIPSGDGVSATFDSVITSPQTVTVDANTTIGSITFNNANRYTIAGPSTLTLQNSSGSASIHVTSGNHTISAPLSFASNTTVTVDSAVNTLTLSGGISAAGVTTTKAGPGTLAIGGNSNNLGSLAIQQGSVQLLSGMSKAVATSGLSVSSGATLDLTNNAMVVNYSGTSPASSIRTAIISAYNNGAWNQPGITSSTAAANANHTTAVGYAEASDLGLANGGTFKGATIANQAVIIKYTYYGDENLDGVVNLDDFSIFIDGFNGLGSGWIYGDFNYDGKIDQTDFSLFVQGFNLNGAPLSQLSDAILSDSSLSASQKNALLSTVPEPASLSLLALAGGSLLARRRRTA